MAWQPLFVTADMFLHEAERAAKAGDQVKARAAAIMVGVALGL